MKKPTKLIPTSRPTSSDTKGKSKKQIFGSSSVAIVAPKDIVSADDVTEVGAVAVLAKLHEDDKLFEDGSQAFHARQVASAYQVACCAMTDQNVWNEICECPSFADVTRKPRSDRPSDALRFCLMLVKGTHKKGRSLASHWAIRLKKEFAAAVPAVEVLKLISRKPNETVPQACNSNARIIQLGASSALAGKIDLGFVKDGEPKSFAFRVTNGKCIRVTLSYEVYASEVAQKSLAAIARREKVAAVMKASRCIRQPGESNRDMVRRIFAMRNTAKRPERHK